LGRTGRPVKNKDGVAAVPTPSLFLAGRPVAKKFRPVTNKIGVAAAPT
jgi:hypothetical protein